MPSVEQKFHKSVEIARALRSRYSTGRCFHVTTAFDKNRLVVIGANNYLKTHPRSLPKKEADSSYIPNVHSELSAILKLGEEDCRGITFFNIRIDKNDEVNNSYPCSGCIELLAQTGYKQFFYSTARKDFKELLK